ncbi:hypothetical protein ACIF70_10250 [Actinacidiphila glaucinigra]
MSGARAIARVFAPSTVAVPHSRRTFIRRRYRGPESNPRKAVTL